MGNVNPGVATPVITPSGTKVFAPLTMETAPFTPKKVNVAMLAPDLKTIELVPDPLHAWSGGRPKVPRLQLKAPCVVNAVSISRSPFGRIVNGVASASPVKGISTPRSNITSERQTRARRNGCLRTRSNGRWRDRKWAPEVGQGRTHTVGAARMALRRARRGNLDDVRTSPSRTPAMMQAPWSRRSGLTSTRFWPRPVRTSEKSSGATVIVGVGADAIPGSAP